MPVCYYCHYQIKEFDLNDNEPGDEYSIIPIARNFEVNGIPCHESMEVAVCEACTSERLTDVS